MAFLQWRRFNFFDKDVVKLSLENKVFEGLKEFTISACAYGRGQMVFGDIEGNLHFLSRQLEINSFKAYIIRVSHLYQLKQHHILVSIGEDEEGINPLIKVWHLEKTDRDGLPTCLRIERAIPGTTPTRVSCLSVHENLSYMAVGFENGSVVLFKGDVTKERHSKQRVIFEGSSVISGLFFRPQSNTKSTTVLYLTTEKDIVSMTIQPKEKDCRMNNLDRHGCKLNCCILSDHQLDHQLIVARNEAVYFYQPDDRGQCLVFEGEKLNMQWFRGYLVIVGKEKKTIPMAGPSKTMDMHLVTVYDVQNKFIAYSGPVPEVSHILCEWGSLYCLATDGRLYQLQEKDTQTKLEILFKKNLYQLAIALAQGQQYDQDGIIDIFRQYGDHLYGKGDHDGAIEQYIKTIGKLEASYVIRKFLDAQRIHNLTAYLQALHQAHLATEDHTTLLLNCYTKLKDKKKLDNFIMREAHEIEFDVETAIRVCRSAGYSEQALYLARKHEQHNWYLKIQLEDSEDGCASALEYMGNLYFEEAEMNAKKYGKELMMKEPDKTTEFLMRLCTDYKPTSEPLVDEFSLRGESTGQVFKAKAEEFIHVFVNNSAKLTEFLEHMAKVEPACSPVVYSTLLELYLHDLAHEKNISKRVERERKTLDLLQSSTGKYDLDQALVLCQMNNFKAGILFLYEKAKLYQQILHYHMEHGSNTHIMDTCKKFGTIEPNLWIQALSYFAGKEENCKAQITEVLHHIDKWNLMPPLLVIQTLAHHAGTTLGVIKDYIAKRLQTEQQQIAEDERLIAQYRTESDKMRSDIEQMKTKATIFNVSKCSVCAHPLELPSVHFLCQHSYHQHCFESYAETESECPACLPENRKVLEIIRAQEQGRDVHEQFHNQLERTQDAFSVVADYFGRGVFNKVTLVTEPKRSTSMVGTSKLVASPQIPSVTQMLSQAIKPNAMEPAPANFPTRTNKRVPEEIAPPTKPTSSMPPASNWPLARQPTVPTNTQSSLPQRGATSSPNRSVQPATKPVKPVEATRPVPVDTARASRETTARNTAVVLQSTNPFEEPNQSTNPFEEAPAQQSNNPFEDAQDYPKEYNPFETMSCTNEKN